STIASHVFMDGFSSEFPWNRIEFNPGERGGRLTASCHRRSLAARTACASSRHRGSTKMATLRHVGPPLRLRCQVL
ncbi:MAG: hypothetical protein ACK56I_19395, partial [bacterium]